MSIPKRIELTPRNALNWEITLVSLMQNIGHAPLIINAFGDP
jgi:hypothetical protein